MVLKLKKDVFLSNTANKQRLINLLGEKLQLSGCNINPRPGRRRPDDSPGNGRSVRQVNHNSPCRRRHKPPSFALSSCWYKRSWSVFHSSAKAKVNDEKIWDIKKTKAALGPETCANILFVQAALGCDTTSGIHGIGKSLALKKITKDAQFQEQAEVFNNEDSTKSDLIAAGRESPCLSIQRPVCRKSGFVTIFRDSARLITIGTSFVQPECLPPTSAATVYHSLRLYHQVQQWRGVALPPLDWGWKLVDGRLLPVRTDLQAAHVSLLGDY